MTPEELIQAREVLGCTQDVLAHHIGVSRRQYIRYETGESDIPTPVAIIVDITLSGRIPTRLKNAVFGAK